MDVSGICTNADTAGLYQKPTKNSGNQSEKAMLPEINVIFDNCEKQVGKFLSFGSARHAISTNS
jgi:hypothetical protein